MAASDSRILLVKPSALGDVCRTMPALASLRAAFPDARIDWLVQDDFADAVRGHPALGGVVEFPRRAWRRWWSPASLLQARSFSRGLRQGGYQLAIDLQGLFRSGWFVRATAAPRRVGWLDARELAWLGTNERHARRAGPDATEMMLALLEDAGVAPVRDPRMHLPTGAAQRWETLRADCGLREGYVALAPTSRWASKRWPAARWKALAEGLIRRGVPVAMLGAPGEMEQVQAAMPASGAVNLCGRMRLSEWMAAIAGSAAVIANDSAATHAAVGFGRPLVAIYGATDPASVGPFGRPDSVVSPPGPAPTDPHAYRSDHLAMRMELVPLEAVRERLDDQMRRGPRW